MTSTNKKYAKKYAEANYFWQANGSGTAVLHQFIHDTPTVVSLEGAVRDLVAWSKSKGQRITEISAEDILKKRSLQHVHTVKVAPTKERLYWDGPYLVLNQWRPHTIQNVEPSETAPDSWVDLITRLFPVEEERRHLEHWFALLTMRPDWQLRHGIILLSRVEGTGKDFLLELIIGEALLGKNNFVGVPLRRVTGQFNANLAGKRLVHIRELYRGGSSSADALKELITSETLTVEKKYEQPYVTDFYGQFVITSNELRPLELSASDRRWFVPTELKPIFDDPKELDRYFSQLLPHYRNSEDPSKSTPDAVQLAQYFEGICRKHYHDKLAFDLFSSRPPTTDAKKKMSKYDLRAEQMETLKEVLSEKADRYAFKMAKIKEALAKERTNLLLEADIREVLEELGCQYKQIRTADSEKNAWLWSTSQVQSLKPAERNVWPDEYFA